MNTNEIHVPVKHDVFTWENNLLSSHVKRSGLAYGVGYHEHNILSDIILKINV